MSRSLAFYDLLNCAATAVNEDGAGRADKAEAAFLEVSVAACGLFPEGSDADAAVTVILDAIVAARGASSGGMLLWNALDAMAAAVLPAVAGDRDCAEMLLAGAEAAVSMLPAPDLEAALTVVAGEIRAMAGSGGRRS
jgi:hypothetical protein